MRLSFQKQRGHMNIFSCRFIRLLHLGQNAQMTPTAEELWRVVGGAAGNEAAAPEPQNPELPEKT